MEGGGGVRPVYQPGPLSLLTFLLCTLTAVQCHANPDLVNKRSQRNVFRLRTNVRPQRNRGMLPKFCNRARGNKVFHFQKVWQPTPWPADVWNTLPHTPPQITQRLATVSQSVSYSSKTCIQARLSVTTIWIKGRKGLLMCWWWRCLAFLRLGASFWEEISL